MSRNGILLSICALVLAVVYVINFTDWFRSKSIQIIHTNRPVGAMKLEPEPGMAPVYPVAFSFRGKHQFTSVRVVMAEDLSTNRYPHALWDLISDRASKPTEYLIYGETPAGMKPSVPGLTPQPLQPGVEYVLLLETDSLKGQTNFLAQAVAR